MPAAPPPFRLPSFLRPRFTLPLRALPTLSYASKLIACTAERVVLYGCRTPAVSFLMCRLRLPAAFVQVGFRHNRASSDLRHLYEIRLELSCLAKSATLAARQGFKVLKHCTLTWRVGARPARKKENVENENKIKKKRPEWEKRSGGA
jgi:hypothetical protein